MKDEVMMEGDCGSGCSCASEGIASPIDRRRFLALSAYAAAAAALAACAVTDATTAPTSVNATVRTSNMRSYPTTYDATAGTLTIG
jgi:hypothetical protein